MKYLLTFLIAFALGALLVLLLPKPEPPPPQVITLYDSVIVEIPIEVPTPYTVIEYLPGDTIYLPGDPADADTVAILADYYRKRIYQDTISDSAVNIFIDETITQNRITQRAVSYQMLLPHTTIINEAETRRYLSGGILVYAGGDTAGFAPYLRLSGDKWNYLLGYDIFHSSVYLGVSCSFVGFPPR